MSPGRAMHTNTNGCIKTNARTSTIGLAHANDGLNDGLNDGMNRSTPA
jgi:hypothetical protein